MIPFTHRVSQRSRSLKISVTSNGEVIVTTPPRQSSRVIEQFVTQHEAWIEQVKAKIKKTKHEVITETSVTIFGKTYQINTTYQPGLPVGVRVLGSEILVNPASPSSKTNPTIALERFLKGTAETYITTRVNKLAEDMSATFTRLSFKQQKTRWGSCSSTGTLSFNWRLVHYEPAIIDYVIIHEIAHRHQMNHSRAFWAIVAKFDPQYTYHRQWLQRHGITTS
ncbi:MAG: M48 family metallopeptidase [bacterium]|nr:M48 family metallopeptidase [bacterium]